MNPATINAKNITLTLAGSTTPLTALAGVTITYDATQNRALIDLSKLTDAQVPLTGTYTLKVTSQVTNFVAATAANPNPVMYSLDGAIQPLNPPTLNPSDLNRNQATNSPGFDTIFPTGNPDPNSNTPSTFTQTIPNALLGQAVPSLGTAGPTVFVRSDSGIPGDQNTDVTRPAFVGTVANTFPGAVGGLTVAVQFNAPNGTFTLKQGQDGRGYTGTPDLVVTTDAQGNFRFQAPEDLPDGLNRVRIIVVGQPDAAPLAGYSSLIEQSFRIDTTSPTISAAPLPPLSSLTSLTLNILDPILPQTLTDPFVVPAQLSEPALDPTSATNVSNYTLSYVPIGAPAGTVPTDASSFIIGATFQSTSARVLPSDPYKGQVVLSFAPNLPAGHYTLTAHRPEPGFVGITDAAGNPIDGNPSTPVRRTSPSASTSSRSRRSSRPTRPSARPRAWTPWTRPIPTRTSRPGRSRTTRSRFRASPRGPTRRRRPS